VSDRSLGRGFPALARAAVSAALLALLFWQVEAGRVIDHLKNLSPLFILLAWVYYAVCQLLSSWRWWLFLAAKGVSVPVTSLFSYYMIGMFLNSFLPSAVGGDAARAYYVYRRVGDGNIALSSVFLERFAGLLGLGVLAVCAVVVDFERAWHPLILATVGGSALFLGAVALLIWWEPLFTRLQRMLGRWLPHWLAPRMQELYGALSSYRRHPAALAKTISLSVVIQGLYGLYFGVVAWGLGIEIDVYYFVLFLLPVTLAMMAPISFGGLGVREATFILLFQEVGVAPTDVLTVSLTAYLLSTPLSLVGGLLLVWQRRVKLEA
jgi:uncharacterized protein (TIRG00374 family)